MKRSAQVKSSSTRTTSSQSTPTVLTRAVIPSLVTHLDASDVLECYYLTRQTVVSGSSGALNMTITKAAIGLRQKNVRQQTAASSSQREKRVPLQLTLEYGPAKDVSQITKTTTTTSGMVAESIPRVIWDELVTTTTTVPSKSGGDAGDNNNNHNKNNQDNDNTAQPQQRIPVTVTWENEGRVYFTTDPIGQGTSYQTANYLSSVSGAVLSHLLQAAVDYSTTHARFRRYQPFAVYQQAPPPIKSSEAPNDKPSSTTTAQAPQLQEVLHSSSDVDFILHMYDTMATLGVSLDPILLPQHTQMRLHVATANNKQHEGGQQQSQKPWEFVQVGKDVSAHDVAEFYAKLMSCLQTLATADTSVYATKQQQNQGNTTKTKAPSSIDKTTTSPSSPPSNKLPRRRRQRELIVANAETETALLTAKSIMPSPAPSAYYSSLSSSSSTTSAVPTTAANTQAPTTELPTRSPTTAKSESEQAAQAAAQAQEAANQAEEAGNKPAAEAAQAAADAAQRAADVTATQQALIHQKALLSGDATSMAATAALCFSDPAYGLAPPAVSSSLPSNAPENNKNSTNNNGIGKNATTSPAGTSTTVPTTAYLYWDGTFYVRVDLVPPYVSVAPLEYRLPRPKQAGTGVTGDDFVDWSLALLIAVMFGMGLLLLLQQVSGRNLKIIRPLYRFQRWFFNPTHYDLQDMDDFSEGLGGLRGMGQEYTFGEDVIPLSMGGRRVSTPTRADGGSGHGISSFFASSSSSTSGGKQYHHLRTQSNGDVEMVSRESSSSHTKQRGNTTGGGGGSSHHSLSSIDDVSERSFDDFSAGLEDARLFRHSDLVDLPNLTRSSKVAVPVSMVGRGSPSPPLDDSLPF